MFRLRRRFAGSARVFGPTSFLLAAALLCASGRPAHAAQPDDHQEAAAALSDVRAAITELMHALDSYSTDRTTYRGSAEQAINALVGTHDTEFYVATAGNPGDAAGAIGHIDHLLDRTATPPWVPALHGAEANIRAAVANLLEAGKARELMDFQIAASHALENLDVAVGRPNEPEVFGGLEGALATTVLGVPAGADVVDACAPARTAPAFGTHAGYLAYVAVPATRGTHALAGPSGGTDVNVDGNVIVLHTTAAPIVARLCGARGAARSPIRAVQAAAADPSPNNGSDPSPNNDEPAKPSASQGAPPQSAAPAANPPGSGSSQPATTQPPHPTPPRQPVEAQPKAENTGPVPALYTKAQAAAGEPIFAQHCVSCHGANLQGTAAPSVAGNDFLDTAKRNSWTLEIIRYIVFTMMPRNSPGTLTAEQSAEVMAYLLASDCYPAGDKPFPTQDDPAFGKIQLGPVPGQHPNENKFGVCALITGSARSTR